MSRSSIDLRRGDDLHRPASVQLRQGREQTEGLMDPANQSLAEALRITYRIVQFAMLVLAALFVFSGVQRVEEGQYGIPLFLGKPTAAGELEPGAHFSAPFPLGEIVKVESGRSQIGIMRPYWPLVAAGAEEMEVDKLAPLPQIAPGRDGSLVTADLNLAHAQWKVDYRRSKPRQYAQNILPEDEAEIVSGAVQSGIVRVVAEIPMDTLLKQSESSEFSAASRVMTIAQEQLDRIEAGIQIDNVTLFRVTAPARLKAEFAGVLSAASSASTQQQQAEGRGREILNKVAGMATPDLVELIDRYEAAIELEEPERAEALLAAINTVFEGGAVEIEGVSVPANLASGEVTEIMATARTQANALRESAEADLRTFLAKRSQFRANPELMMFRDWVAAYDAFTSKAYVQTEILPSTADWRVMLNADPELAREIYRDIARRKAEETDRMRREQIQQRRFETNPDAQQVGG